MIRVRSNLQVTIQSLKDWNRDMAKRIRVGLYRSLLVTAARTQTEYLQGPRPRRLGEVTTALRRSITARATINADRVLGEVGTNIPYAAYHEFGFDGTQPVRAHTRTLRFTAGGEWTAYTRRGVTGLFKPLKRYAVRDLAGRIVGYKASIKDKFGALAKARKITVQTGQVKAHTRRIRYSGRPFLRPALKDTFQTIVDEVAKEAAK